MFGRKKKYDFYVGGPMRGCKDLNKPMFTVAARLLRAKGYMVWSPSEHGSYIESSFAKCMTKDFNAVVNLCRGIALLPDWKNSIGANMEAFIAFGCGKNVVEIIFNEDNTRIELVHIDLSGYRLPYQIEKSCQFNPHECDDEQ